MSLRGLTILVTRPKPEGEVLSNWLNNAQAKVYYFPTITIEPVENKDLLRQQIAALNQFDWLIFNSRHAVYQSVDDLFAAWPVFPSTLQVAAIGPGTVDALNKLHLPVTVFPLTDWRSEGLLELPVFQHVKHQRIALMTAAGGRGLLQDMFVQRGADVTAIIAYRRTLPDTELDFHLLAELDIMICTSNEVLTNLIQLTNGFDLREIPLLVISERMFQFAKNLGFKCIFLAANPSHDAIMAVLSAKKDELCQMKRKK